MKQERERERFSLLARDEPNLRKTHTGRAAVAVVVPRFLDNQKGVVVEPFAFVCRVVLCQTLSDAQRVVCICVPWFNIWRFNVC